MEIDLVFIIIYLGSLIAGPPPNCRTCSPTSGEKSLQFCWIKTSDSALQLASKINQFPFIYLEVNFPFSTTSYSAQLSIKLV